MFEPFAGVGFSTFFIKRVAIGIIPYFYIEGGDFSQIRKLCCGWCKSGTLGQVLQVMNIGCGLFRIQNHECFEKLFNRQMANEQTPIIVFGFEH